MLETNLNTQDTLQKGTLAGFVGGAIINLAVQLSLRGGSPSKLISDTIIGTGGKMVRYIMMPDGVSVDDATLSMVENASMGVFREDSEGYTELRYETDRPNAIFINRVQDVCDDGEVTGTMQITSMVGDTLADQGIVTDYVILEPYHHSCDVPDTHSTFAEIIIPEDDQLNIQVVDVTTEELDLIGGNYHAHDSNDLDLGPLHLDVPDFLDNHLSFPGTIQLTSALLSVASGVAIALVTRGISELRNRRNSSK